jgi:peptidoglycan/LPS O-acetylase OafA/YrhL
MAWMKGTGHIGSLDAVRGVAALLVCLFHATTITYQGSAIVDWRSFPGSLINGHGAVVMFFVLSGAVLRISLARRACNDRPWATDFLIARAFRIYPAVIAAILLFAVVALIFRGGTPDIGTIVRNALLLEITQLGNFWTLQVEVVGSVLVLLAFALERRFGLWPVAALAALLIVASFASERWRVQYINAAMLYPFLIGYLIALVPAGRVSTRMRPWILAAAIIVFFGAGVCGFVLKKWLLVLTVASSAIIVMVLSSAEYRDRFSWAPLRLLGLWSYSYYALHPFALMACTPVSVALQGAGISIPVATVILMLLPAALTALMAAPFFYFVERPGIALGAWLRRAVNKRDHASLASVQ